MTEIKQLDRIRAWLDRVYRRKITENYDRVVLVVGDEGAGKSTLMLQCAYFWEEIRGNDPGAQDIIDRIVFGQRDEYKEMLLESDSGDVITVQDAAHVLFSREAMHGDQIEIEKAMLDMRIENYMVFLGFQDWRDVPDALRRRRAKNVLRVPERGVVLGYNRASMDEKYDNNDGGWWPDADFEDRFPSLEGTQLWEAFEDADADAKRERLEDNQQIDTADARKQEHIKVALRMAQPWDDNSGEKYRDIAKYIDYEIGWISERVAEWKEGEYRDLIEQDDTVHRVTERVEA